MNNVVWVLVAVAILVTGVIWYQKTRTDRTLQTLSDSGFVVSRQWRSNVLLVADDDAGKLAIVWPGHYQVLAADSLTGIEVRDQEMEASRHRYTLELTFSHPQVERIGLAMNQRGDRANAWADEIRQWRDRNR